MIDYHRPTTLEAAVALKASLPDARYVAGGTDLLVRIASGLERPAALVSLRNIPALHEIAMLDGRAIAIGAACPLSEVEAHPAIREGWPLLSQAIATMGSVQIRNAGTLGGNLCNASPCADAAPPLMVLGSEARVVGPAGERRVALDELCVGPRQTVLGPHDVLAAIEVPPAGEARAVFYKKTRVAMDLALVNLAALLVVREGKVLRARLVAGAVGPVPMRLAEVEQLLLGRALDDEVIAKAKALACELVRPIDDIRAGAAYRRHLVGVFLERALRGDPRGAAALAGAASDPPTETWEPTDGPAIDFSLNGERVRARVAGHERLVDVLRSQLGLHGTKEGCGKGECGACTVHVDGRAMNACLLSAREVEGRSVTTIEGLAGPRGELSPLQQAFVARGGIQCGFCSPGMIMSAQALLSSQPDAGEGDIRAALRGNLCRCTGYAQIVDAIKHARGDR